MRVIRFFVEGDPKGKGRPRFIRATGHAITPPASASYERMVQEHARLAMCGQLPLQGPLRLTLVVYFARPPSWRGKQLEAVWHTSKPDWDNLGKMISDAMNGIVFKDDAQIAEAFVVKKYGLMAGVQILVEEIKP
jgi:Holliday junction resolvase RusA-like endonuclease